MTALPRHHPKEECLLAYANGCLGEAESLFLATHLAYCPPCRGTARLGESVGSHLLAGSAVVPVSSTCRDKVFAALDSPACADAAPPAPASPECFIPEPLRRYLGGAGCRGGVQQLSWQSVAPGQREFPLPLSAFCLRRGAAARLVVLRPETPFTKPQTGHRLVLQPLCGSLRDDDTVYERGDIVCGVTDNLRSGAEECYALLLITPPRRTWMEKLRNLLRMPKLTLPRH